MQSNLMQPLVSIDFLIKRLENQQGDEGTFFMTAGITDVSRLVVFLKPKLSRCIPT